MAAKMQYSSSSFSERAALAQTIDKRKRNILSVVNPGLAAEWHPTKNEGLTPDMVTAGSNKKVWWRCRQGHEWQATINSRNRGNGCPYCSGYKVWKGFNDLATVNPELAAEWHPTKNGELTPDMVTAGNGKKVWWKCKLGHEWSTKTCNRARGSACPYCFGRKAWKGFNDLATVNPSLAAEWHPTKNGRLTPDIVTLKCNKKVWWRCKIGHEWTATINNRSRGSGCPYCHKELNTSFSEQAVYYYVHKRYADAVNGDKSIGKELDIMIPSIKTAIEYDGSYYHTNAQKDEQKNALCEKHGIRLIRIREKGAKKINADDVIIRDDLNDKSLNEVIVQVLSLLDIDDRSVSVEKDRVKIYNQYVAGTKERSLSVNNPSLASEWHPTKNGKLTPEMVAAGSTKKIWWKCKEGHEWQARITDRNRRSGCPYCSGHKVWKGFNDLTTVNPELAAEWHPTKNDGLMPDMVTAGNNKKVWWRCRQGHEWQARIANRSKGNGCPYCSGQYAIKEVSDLATVSPELAAEWHPTKNEGLTPDMVMLKSGKRVWWKCKEGHEWQAVIYSRARGENCPCCSGHKVWKGFNDLVTVNPSLAAEWHPTKNGDLTPDMITVGSSKKVWWRCKSGHEWQAKISNRSNDKGCPYCSGKRVLKGLNDLATVNPELAAEWHPTKNNDLKPDMVTRSTGKKIWWKCSRGHEWQAIVRNRNRGVGCPVCYNLRRSMNRKKKVS